MWSVLGLNAWRVSRQLQLIKKTSTLCIAMLHLNTGFWQKSIAKRHNFFLQYFLLYSVQNSFVFTLIGMNVLFPYRVLLCKIIPFSAFIHQKELVFRMVGQVYPKTNYTFPPRKQKKTSKTHNQHSCQNYPSISFF